MRQGQPFDKIIPETVSEESLPGEVVRLHRAGAVDEETASQLNLFDLLAFRQQLGEDDDLMREIIAIFFEESGHQLADLRNALNSGEYRSASRIAHSLKGSLGNMHSDRARHWAQALETAALANDADASAKCLAALEQSISALTPTLEKLIKA
jgi:HPt (histidine-containing phosphotransfer) domain-containing protein